MNLTMALAFINAEKHQNDTVIFPSFNLEVKSGTVVALYSNLNIRKQQIDLMLGKAYLSSGDIHIAGKPVIGKMPEIGFLLLEQGLYERLSIDETLQFYKRLYNSAQPASDVLQKLQLEPKRGVKVRSLSYSEQKRLQLACLLIHNPDVYLMEEPDQNLDVESKKIFLGMLNELRAQGKSVLILTGNLESAVTAGDQVYRLDDTGLHLVETKSEEPVEEPGEGADLQRTEDIEMIQPIRFEKIPTKVNEKIVLFDPPEIDYIESSEGQSFLHIKGEAFPSFFTLNDLEERLLPFGFFRCHRSYIVNLQKVREVITWTRNSYSLVLDDAAKSEIPLSKTKMADLKGMLGLK